MNNTINTIDLMAFLSSEIRCCEEKIKEYPNLGTVKDNGTLGMKLAYQHIFNEIQNFKCKASEGFKMRYEKEKAND